MTDEGSLDVEKGIQGKRNSVFMRDPGAFYAKRECMMIHFCVPLARMSSFSDTFHGCILRFYKTRRFPDINDLNCSSNYLPKKIESLLNQFLRDIFARKGKIYLNFT